MSIDLIADWHRYELGRSCVPHRPHRMLAGFPLWGEKYALWFAHYGMPSILAPANRHALGGDSHFVVYVDTVARKILSPFIDQMCAPVELRVLPETLVALAQATPQLKYPLMTAVHSLLIKEAADCGAGFSMAVGDLVYSDRYLSQLLALGETHDAIVHVALSVDHQRLGGLWPWRSHYGRLAMPATHMGRLGYHHMQRSWRSWSMSDSPEFPSSHLIFWRGKDYLRVHCPHMGPVWLGPERCRAAGVIPVINGGIDAEVPRLMAGDFYMPQFADDMMLITLNDEAPAQDRWPFDMFKQNLLRLFGPYREWQRYFTTPCNMPAAMDGGPYLEDDVIETQWQELLTRLGV